MDENEHIREVYAKYGLAMYFAQCVEVGIATLITFVYSGISKELSKTDIEKIWNSLSQKTFGMLVKELAKRTNIPESLQDRLIEARNKRNWLAHHYFYERAAHFYDLESRQLMIEELITIKDNFLALNDELDEIFNNWIDQHSKNSKENLLRQGMSIISEEDGLDLDIDEIIRHWNETC